MLNQNGGIIGPANIPTTTSAKGKWSLAEYYLAKRQNIWPSVTPNSEPYYPYTTLLLPGNGTNGAQNNTFLDSGTANGGVGFTITRNGNTTQGTFSPFSQTGWGNYFNGSNAYLSLTATSAVQLTNSTAFAIEFWVYPASIPSTGGSAFVLRAYNMSSPYQGYGIAFGGDTLNTNLQFWNGTAWANIGAVSANTWTHVAVTYEGSGTTLRYFINGQQQGSATTVPSSINYTGTPFIIGARNNDLYLNGYLSNLRIVKGSAVYTSNFTPSTTPLTAITNTSLLTCQSNRFLDNSSSPYTITPSGSPSVVAFSPFNPTASWSAATYGGSGYFDGNGDYLSVADNAALNIGTADYQISCWIYPTAFITSNVIVGKGSGNILFYYNSSGILSVAQYGGSNIATASQALVLNQWSYITASRVSNVTKIFINNTEVASASDTSNYTSSTALQVGQDPLNTSQKITGYLADFRFVKNSGVTSVTVPTAPLTAITNTSLLLNFTNAGIYDATSKNDLETLDNTVNGVRISTTQSKFGGSSIYFDGTGTDYLWIQADQPIQRFGTAPFTIEMWIRLAALGSARGLVAKGTSTTGWLVSLNTSNQVVFTYGTSTITSTGTISQDVWTYIAVVREGTSTNQTKIYIGGVNDGTGTVSTDFTQTSSMYIGANRTGGDLYSGYIQDVRITNGYARTVTTVPTAAFPTL